MKSLHKIAYILVIVGALNWGLTAFDMNLVYMLLGSWPTVEMLVYILVGLSAVYEVATHKKNCRDCVSNSSPQM